MMFEITELSRLSVSALAMARGELAVEEVGEGEVVAFVLVYGCVQITRDRAAQPASYSLHATPRAPLFLVNHWVTDKLHTVQNAETVNARDVLAPRLAACAAERGRTPNFVAVDFYDRGDVFAVVDELNGLD